MRGSSRRKWELQRAKVEHKVSKLNNPVLFDERRIELASYLMQELVKNPPYWGSLKIGFAKTL